MFRIKLFVCCIVLTCIATGVAGWGFLVHRSVNQLAIYQLPEEIRGFFYRNSEYLVTNAPRPDTRRNSDSTEASKHFIDLEAFGEHAADKMPLKWKDAVKKFSKDTLLKYGTVPYEVMFVKEKLTRAFKNRNSDSILFYAADLGHYIGDANVPLHTTINYDGQLTNQKGLHSLWESMIPEIEISNYNLKSFHQATYLPKPEEAIMQAIRRANKLLPDVLAKEKEVSGKFTESEKYRVQMRRGKESKSYTSSFAKAYAQALGSTINDQLINSANLIADFWFTSWVDAGKPDLSGLLQPALGENDKNKLAEELKSYNSNSLLKDNLLKAKSKSENKEEN